MVDFDTDSLQSWIGYPPVKKGADGLQSGWGQSPFKKGADGGHSPV